MLKWIVNVLPILTTCCFCHYLIIFHCSLSMIGYCITIFFLNALIQMFKKLNNRKYKKNKIKTMKLQTTFTYDKKKLSIVVNNS